MTVKPESVYTIPPTDRVLRLRETFLNYRPKMEIERTRIHTRTMKETEGEPMVIRRAKAFANICREMPIEIAPDELIVGYLSATRRGFKAEVEHTGYFELVIDSPHPGFDLSDADEKELRQEIIPYWKGSGKWERTPEGLLSQYLQNSYFARADDWPSPAIEVAANGNFCIDYGHQVVDYKAVLEKGYLGILQEARDRMDSLDLTDPQDLERVPFIRAVIIAMEAAAQLGRRFAARAWEMVKEETEAGRKEELLKIAEVCDRVPAHPARTFYEALQSIRFTFILLSWETPETRGTSLPRMDRELMPYYEQDLIDGVLPEKEAQELIDCFMMQVPQIGWPNDDNHYYVVGDEHVPHLSVGGMNADGTDATNPLSYMFVESMMHLRLPEPNLSITVHGKSPDSLLIKAAQMVSLGAGNPMFQNHDVITLAMMSREQNGHPVSLEEARTATYAGCQEPFVTGKDGLAINVPFINVPLAMELAMNNGVSRVYGIRIGPETGDPAQFSSFEDVRTAFCTQLRWLIANTMVTSNLRLKVLGELRPTVFTSALLGCLESGIPRELGGCKFHWGPGVMGTGIPDAADSLSALKKVVFEDKKFSMAEVLQAMRNNFEGHDDIFQALNKAPKFGVGEDMPDEIMAWAVDFFCKEVKKHKNIFGGTPVPTVQALYFYAAYGEQVGALPSGRKAGTPLSSGIAPCNNVHPESATTVFHSMGKVDTIGPSDGQVLNIRLDHGLFDEPERGWQTVVDHVRTCLDQKIFHVQFNVLDPEMLKEAQREPEKYKDLTVRVAGYCCYFVPLPKAIQDDIINRAIFG